MFTDGYIKLYRNILKNPVWEVDKPFTKGQAWVDLLLITNYYSNLITLKNGTVAEIKRGQCGYSKKGLADRWGWSIGKVTRYLKLLSDLKMIRQKNTQNHTIITVLNYSKYQDETTNKTTNRITKDITKEITKETTNGKLTERQTENKQKQIKKEKKDNKEKNNKTKILFNKIFDSVEDFKKHIDLKPIFETWLDYKQEIKDQYKGEIGTKNAFKKLIDLSGGNKDLAQKIIFNCTANGWKGLYEYKENSNNKTEQKYNKKNGWQL
jgi:hypothetical protein